MGKSYVKKHPDPVLENDWESLDEGETIRVHCNHPTCEDKNDAFTITRILGGCIYNCYRCGTSGSVFKGSNPKEAISRIDAIRNKRYINAKSNAARHRVQLPRDHIPLVTYDKAIPPHAHAYLYQYELDDEDFDKYYISYSPKLERIIYPIYDNTKLIAWQGRDIYYNRNLELFNKGFLKRKPLKYYTEYYNSNNNIILYYKLLNNNNNKIILVEDIISAIKLYNHYNYNIIALLNSTLHNRLITDLSLRDYKEVIIWLDPDKKIDSIQGVLRWVTMGISTKTHTTTTDPKDVYYTNMPSL